MNNPIINPLWIYLIDLLNNLNDCLFALSLFLGAGLFVGFIFYFLWRGSEYSSRCDEDIENNKLYKCFLKRGVIIFIILSVLDAVIPSEKVMYTMFVSSYITQENIELTSDAITDMVDYIFEKVDELGADD